MAMLNVGVFCPKSQPSLASSLAPPPVPFVNPPTITVELIDTDHAGNEAGVQNSKALITEQNSPLTAAFFSLDSTPGNLDSLNKTSTHSLQTKLDKFLLFSPFSELNQFYCEASNLSNMLSLPSKHSMSSFNLKRSVSSSDGFDKQKHSSTVAHTDATESDTGLNKSSCESVELTGQTFTKARVRFSSDFYLDSPQPSIRHPKPEIVVAFQSVENIRPSKNRTKREQKQQKLYLDSSAAKTFRAPTRSITDNFLHFLSKFNPNSSVDGSKRDVSNSHKGAHLSSCEQNSILAKLARRKSTSVKNNLHSKRSSHRSLLFSSLASRYLKNKMASKCIVACDSDKHGRAISEKLKRMKAGTEKRGSDDSNESEDFTSLIEDVLFDPTTQSFFRKITTTIVKLYEVTEMMDLLDATQSNVLFVSFLSCYGNDMDYVPGKRTLENCLLEMGMHYDDDELEKKDSRRVLYNLVILRKLKLFREFLKLVRTALPSFEVHAILILPQHFDISFHENPSPGVYKNAEFLQDINLNVLNHLEKRGSVQIEFLDSKSRVDVVGNKAMESILIMEKRKDRKGILFEAAHRINPLLNFGRSSAKPANSKSN